MVLTVTMICYMYVTLLVVLFAVANGDLGLFDEDSSEEEGDGILAYLGERNLDHTAIESLEQSCRYNFTA